MIVIIDDDDGNDDDDDDDDDDAQVTGLVDRMTSQAWAAERAQRVNDNLTSNEVAPPHMQLQLFEVGWKIVGPKTQRLRKTFSGFRLWGPVRHSRGTWHRSSVCGSSSPLFAVFQQIKNPNFYFV